MFCHLTTPEGDRVSDRPWQAYPRPQLRRDSWLNLNGMWEFAVQDTDQPPTSYDRTIRVPFCPESQLSGIHTHFPEGSYLFYRRRFSLPEHFVRDRVLLHIGAADQVLDCWVNGRPRAAIPAVTTPSPLTSPTRCAPTTSWCCGCGTICAPACCPTASR